MVEWSITAGCKPVARSGYGGSNPFTSTIYEKEFDTRQIRKSTFT